MRVLIADSQAKVRNALCVLLRQQSNVEIVGVADSASELLTQTEGMQPDLILVHWRLSGYPGEPLLASLRVACPGVRILALSARPESCHEALRAGADAFVSKMDQPEKLLAAIHRIAMGIGEESVPVTADHEDASPVPAAITEPTTEGLSDQKRRGASHRSLKPSTHVAT